MSDGLAISKNRPKAVVRSAQRTDGQKGPRPFIFLWVPLSGMPETEEIPSVNVLVRPRRAKQSKSN
jgi:hypothetical protein